MDEIQAVLSGFVGSIQQVPPKFSAIKIDGRRAYELARRDEDVTIEPRTVQVHGLELVERADADHARFRVEGGKGLYVRALGRDLALQLGTLGHISHLRRTRVGPFSIDKSLKFEAFDVFPAEALLADHLLAIETVLADIPALALTQQEASRLRHGQGVPVLPVASRAPFDGIAPGDTVLAMAAGRLEALVTIAGGEIRPVRVFNH